VRHLPSSLNLGMPWTCLSKAPERHRRCLIGSTASAAALRTFLVVLPISISERITIVGALLLEWPSQSTYPFISGLRRHHGFLAIYWDIRGALGVGVDNLEWCSDGFSSHKVVQNAAPRSAWESNGRKNWKDTRRPLSGEAARGYLVRGGDLDALATLLRRDHRGTLRRKRKRISPG
jgi:hypothetical protein